MNKIYSHCLFLLALAGISYIYGYHKIIDYPPYSIHQWRQADGLSIALNYYKEGMNFFEPKIHFNYSDEGRAVGEFPIIYYLNAIIWKITGQSHFTARLINLLLVYTGLFALYKSIYHLMNSHFQAIIIPLIVFSSPLMAFYSNNFLVNAPALSLLFVCWYYFIRYYKDKSLRYLGLFAFFATISVLLRTTMIIGIVPILLLFLVEKIRFFKNRIFANNLWLEGLLLSLPCISIIAWLLFVRNYNASGNSVYYLTTVRPFWELERDDIFKTWHMLKDSVLPTVYHPGILFLTGISIIVMLLYIRKMNKYMVVFNISILVFLFIYMLLWYANLNVHDYYLIELLMFIPPLLIILTDYSKKHLPQLYKSKEIKILVFAILIFSIGYSAVKTRLKYNSTENVLTQLLLPEREIDLWDWYHWDYESKFRAYESITPYLRSLGIKRDDIVVSIPDPSPNISLYFMDQKGFTSLYQDGKPVREQLDYFIDHEAKYLIINDTTLYQKEEFKEYRQNKIGRYKNIEIFKLQ
ncbi:MAG: glycosyltransferase family 39 protein [Prolixibacteraceae bacterium]|nr:glycosyltransferase family 39 protein [Prolixibacteraceae bacterium]